MHKIMDKQLTNIKFAAAVFSQIFFVPERFLELISSLFDKCSLPVEDFLHCARLSRFLIVFISSLVIIAVKSKKY